MYTLKIANNVTMNIPELKDFLYKRVSLTNFKCFSLSCYVSNMVCYTSSYFKSRNIHAYTDVCNDYIYLYQRQKFRKNKRAQRNLITIYKVPVDKVKYAKQYAHHFKLELI